MKYSPPGLVVRALAFLLCILLSITAFWTGILTLSRWDDVWSAGDYYDSNSIHGPLYSYHNQLREALHLSQRESWGEELTYSQKTQYASNMAALDPQVTNFRYQVHDEVTGALIMDNLNGKKLSDTAVSIMRSTDHTSFGEDYRDGDVFSYSDDGTSTLRVSTAEGVVICTAADSPVGEYNAYGYLFDGDEWRNYDPDYDTRIHTTSYSIEYGAAVPFTVQDDLWTDRNRYETVQPLLAPLAAVAGVTLVLAAGLILFLCRWAGRRRDTEGVVLSWQEHIPLDVYALLFIFAFGGCVTAVESAAFSLQYNSNPATLVGLSVFSAAVAALMLGALLTVIVRLKARMFWRSMLIVRVCAWLWRSLRRGFSRWSLISRAVILFVLYLLGTLLTGATLILIPVYQGFVLWCICLYVKQWKTVRSETQRMVNGEADVTIDTRHMFPELREHAEQLNDLGAGMNRAMQEQLKGERFKAELITNVSHDLKTPLTSIINYVDLLRKTDIQDPTAQEYIDVLDRKSQRLKKLTEDLVEASKASTGNLSVNKEKLGFTQLLSQALGEYEEKLTANGLSVVAAMPDHELYVEADGRHLWRVIDNLLGNCAKYAMPETRVYVDVKAWDGQVCLSVKNISKAPLNVPAEQLMERFVRGDESRTTEGSGLGLSIAQSLTELQGGNFRVDIDGDLFKAVVTFPERREPIPLPESPTLSRQDD